MKCEVEIDSEVKKKTDENKNTKSPTFSLTPPNWETRLATACKLPVLGLTRTIPENILLNKNLK